MLPSAVKKAASLPDISIRIMLRVLEEEGMDTQPALDAAGLPNGLPAMPGTVSAAQEFAFQSAFVKTTGYRPDLWVRTGGAYHLPSFGQLGFALITSSTLEDYLSTSADTRDLDYSLAEVHYMVGEPTVTGYRIDISNVPKDLQEFTLYRDLGAIVTTLRDLWGGRFPLRQIQVALPSPCNDNFTVLGEQVTFWAEQNSVTWNSDYNRCQLHHGNSFLHAAYMESLKQKDAEPDFKDRFIGILEGFIARSPGSQLSLAMLAAEVGTTERTLQRQLKARNLNFRTLVNEARHRTAIEMLTTSSLSIKEIAFSLGFSDAIGFSQAFRRWNGRTPAALRRQNLNAAFGENPEPKDQIGR